MRENSEVVIIYPDLFDVDSTGIKFSWEARLGLQNLDWLLWPIQLEPGSVSCVGQNAVVPVGIWEYGKIPSSSLLWGGPFTVYPMKYPICTH